MGIAIANRKNRCDFGALSSPLPKQRSDGFLLEFVLKGPQALEHSTKIANKQNHEQTGVPELQHRKLACHVKTHSKL